MVSLRLVSVFLCTMVVMLALAPAPAEAATHIGSCVWGAVNYFSDCRQECRNRGYKSGHCGSFFNVNCWCD